MTFDVFIKIVFGTFVATYMAFAFGAWDLGWPANVRIADRAMFIIIWAGVCATIAALVDLHS